MSMINLKRGQAYSLQWVASLLEKVKQDLEDNGTKLTKKTR